MACMRAVRGPGGGSSWNLAFCRPKNVLQRLQNIKCFWKKNPINFRVQISSRVKTMHNAWIPPSPISLLNISVYRLQPRLFIDSLPYLKKTKRTIKRYGSAARLDQAIFIKALTSQNSFVGFVLFFFTIPWLVCFFYFITSN